jgi:hypothetical protein
VIQNYEVLVAVAVDESFTTQHAFSGSLGTHLLAPERYVHCTLMSMEMTTFQTKSALFFSLPQRGEPIRHSVMRVEYGLLTKAPTGPPWVTFPRSRRTEAWYCVYGGVTRTEMFPSLSEENTDASSTGSVCREASRPLPSGPHLPVSRSRLST